MDSTTTIPFFILVGLNSSNKFMCCLFCIILLEVLLLSLIKEKCLNYYDFYYNFFIKTKEGLNTDKYTKTNFCEWLLAQVIQGIVGLLGDHTTYRRASKAWLLRKLENASNDAHTNKVKIMLGPCPVVKSTLGLRPTIRCTSISMGYTIDDPLSYLSFQALSLTHIHTLFHLGFFLLIFTLPLARAFDNSFLIL